MLRGDQLLPAARLAQVGAAGPTGAGPEGARDAPPGGRVALHGLREPVRHDEAQTRLSRLRHSELSALDGTGGSY